MCTYVYPKLHVARLAGRYKHLWKQQIKYEDMRTATQHIKHNSSLFKFDIHSAYHHVDICYPHNEYLGFSSGIL
jgi:hypothetical protein